MTATTTYTIEPFEAVPDPAWSLDRDLRKAASTLGPNEVRYLVDSYYAAQDMRKQSAQRRDAAAVAGEPNELMNRLFYDTRRLEQNIRYALDKWGQGDETCQWARSIPGIGPVIAAGLRAQIDITHCPTVGHLWSFAGLNPDQQWGKGEKRPWNAGLKTLCWKAGESFVKVNAKDDDYYGHIYLARKTLEHERNDRGEFADQAAAILVARPTHAQAAIYREGKLPDGHIHSRAKRYAVKLFLAHWHHVAYVLEYGKEPPKPYIFTDQAKIAGHGDHVHFLAPPNWPM